MDEKTRQKLDEIIGLVKCPKDFKCANNGFEGLCKARDVGLNNYLECLEDNPAQCKFSLLFGYTYLCVCPIRVFIAKKLKK